MNGFDKEDLQAAFQEALSAYIQALVEETIFEALEADGPDEDLQND